MDNLLSYIDISYITGIAAMVILSANFVGFWKTSFETEGLVRSFSLFILALCVAYIFRTIWWDIIRHMTSERVWRFLVNSTGGLAINTIFNIIIIAGGYHGLKVLYLMIEDKKERDEYSWWNAWLYPKKLCWVKRRK